MEKYLSDDLGDNLASLNQLLDTIDMDNLSKNELRGLRAGADARS